MTEQLVTSTPTPDSAPANSLIQTFHTWVFEVEGDPQEFYNEVINYFKGSDNPQDVLFNPNNHEATLHDMPDNKMHMTVTSQWNIPKEKQ